MSQSCFKSDAPKFVAIAPTSAHLEMDYNTPKKYNYKTNPYTGAQAASIARRNARERNRVKQVNDGFNALRKRLPAAVINALSGGSRRGSGKKLSKVDTLRMVVEYIRYMENLIDESDAALGITKPVAMEVPVCDVDEGVFDRCSPYSDPVPSPANSDCSSGVSSNVSNDYYGNYQTSDLYPPSFNDNELLDAITWWQAK
ncbi:unnamed protein product [Leptidea sinapis]|uniref:BHLH domain-containing protein n=1 Tax=Leptidea sinapis TaxID=189913 RepID=A0A5E4Q2L4_9NEOP|nr:unnamed protein product [Leptidea sinapis]